MADANFSGSLGINVGLYLGVGSNRILVSSDGININVAAAPNASADREFSGSVAAQECLILGYGGYRMEVTPNGSQIAAKATSEVPDARYTGTVGISAGLVIGTGSSTVTLTSSGSTLLVNGSPYSTADFYVSATGSDSADGTTPATAWQTIAKIASSVGANKTVALNYGDMWRLATSFTVPAAGITFTAYGNSALGRPKIKGSMDISGTYAVFSGAIYSKTQAGMTAGKALTAWLDEDTTLVPAASTGAMTAGSFFCDAAGNTIYVWLADSSNPTGRVLDLCNTSANSFIIDNKASTNWLNIAIKNGGGNALFSFPGSSGTASGVIDNCEVASNAGVNIIWGNRDGGEIRYCSIHDAWNGVAYPTGMGPGIAMTTATNGLRIHHNTIYRNFKGISSQGSAPKQWYAYYNLLYANYVNSIDHTAGTTAFQPGVYHNTIHHSPSTVFDAGHGIDSQTSPVAGIDSRNNLIYSDYAGVGSNVELHCIAPDPSTLSPKTIEDYNLLWATPGSTANYGKVNTTIYTTFALYKAALVAQGANVVGQEAHGVNADPLFTNVATRDYTLQAGSPARGAGVAIPGIGQTSPINLGCF